MRRSVMLLCGVGIALGSSARAESPSPPPPEGGVERAEVPPETVEVVVHGQSGGPLMERADPTPASYVVRGAVLREPGATAAEVLARVPGVQVARSGSGLDLATATVRGAPSAQTPIYLGGVRLNDDLTGSVDLSTLPLWMLDRLEIYRGHAPLDADRLGMGGAIFAEPRFAAGTEAHAGLTVGSFGSREVRGSLAFGDDAAGARLAVRAASTDGDYDLLDDRGTALDLSDDVRRRRINAEAMGLDAWATGRLRLRGGGGVTLLLNGLDRSGGAPGLQVVPARRSRYALRRWLAGARARLPCAGSVPAAPDAPGTACEVVASTSLLRTQYLLDDPARELGPAVTTHNHGLGVTQRLHWQGLALPNVWVRAGGTFEGQGLAVDVAGAPSARSSRRSARLSLGSRVAPHGALRLSGTAALECHTTTGVSADGRVCGVLAPVARLGVRWQPAAPVSVFSNVGRAVRVPTLGELHGTSAAVQGNPDLRVERGLSADLGVTVAGAVGPLQGYAQVLAFARTADDLIVYRRSSFGALQPYNAGSGRVLGAEVAAGAALWQHVRLGAQITAMDPRDTSAERAGGADLLPLHARLVAAPELSLTSPPVPAADLDEATLTARFTTRSSRVADPAGLVVLPAQSTLDLSGAVALHQRRLWLRGRLDNLLDQRQLDLVGYPLPGRAGHASVEGWW